MKICKSKSESIISNDWFQKIGWFNNIHRINISLQGFCSCSDNREICCSCCTEARRAVECPPWPWESYKPGARRLQAGCREAAGCASVCWGGLQAAGELCERPPPHTPLHKMEVLHAIVSLLVLPFVLIVRMGVACRLGRGLVLFLLPGLLTLEAAASQDRELQLSWLRCSTSKSLQCLLRYLYYMGFHQRNTFSTAFMHSVKDIV